MSATAAKADVASRVHPLDPLSKAELELLIGALRRDAVIDHRHLITMMQVEEPSKAQLARVRLGENIDRAARVTVLDRSTGKVSEIVAAIGVGDSCRIVSNKIIEGAKDNPFGYGYGGVFWGENSSAYYIMDEFFINLGHSHNGFVDSILEIGYVGPLIYVLIIRCRNRNPRHLLRLHFAVGRY